MKPSKSFEETRKSAPKLPKLGVTSLMVFLGLYSFLVGFIIFLVELGKIENVVGMAFIVGFVFIQFLVSPWIMDFSLRMVGSLKWVKLEELPPHLSSFVTAACQSKKLPIPRIGIIEDGAPNAFTYGNTARNARLVVTQGLLTMLTPKEVEAVVAHELGHITHADFIFMTLAQLIPVLFYQIYRILSGAGRKNSGNNRKDNGALLYAALVAYFAYVISQYVVLFLSRLREYWADRFSVELTRDPKSMITALIKVAYGFSASTAIQKNNLEIDDKKLQSEQEVRWRKMRAVQAMGIADLNKSSPMSLYAASANGKMPPADAMAWDLANPWARFFELQSTHPMTAKRIRAISDFASSLGLDAGMAFPKVASVGWIRFFYEVFVHFLPYTTAVGLTIAGSMADSFSYRYLIAGFALGILLRMFFAYSSGPFKSSAIAELLKETKASPITSIPVVLRGKIIGRGVPGYIFSKDFVLQDETGFIFLDYQSPIPFFNFFFGLLRSGKFQGQNVVVEGWYRRAPMPFVEIRRLRSESSGALNCYRRIASMTWWGLVFAACATQPFWSVFL